MRTVATLAILLLVPFIATEASADANRESLIGAWEAHVRSLPGTVRLETAGDDVFELEDTDLPYEGELTIVGVLVRPVESVGYETGYSHIGIVELALADMPAELASTQVYYYWLNDRQTFYYSVAEQRWVDTPTYQASIADIYEPDAPFGALSFMLNYGIWIFIFALVIFGFVAVGKQTAKARALLDDSASINQKARENIDRAESLQTELLGIARETRDLQTENNALLKQMLDALKR